MDHISANLAFGARRRKKPMRKTEKKVATFFFVFLETVKILWGAAKKSAGGHQMVTLRH